MFVPRAISQCRLALSRGVAGRRATGPILHFTSTSAPQRQFTSSARFWEEVSQRPATEPEAPLGPTRDGAADGGNKSHGIAVTKLNRNTTPAEIQKILSDAGVDIKKVQFRIDRFTFQNSTSAFFELGSEEQVQKAVTALEGLRLGKQPRPLRVSPLADTFHWEAEDKKKQHYFLYDAAAPSQAIRPLLEGRRYTIFVENPGWGRGKAASINTQKQKILEKTFGPFNVEAFGTIHPVWMIDRRSHMTFVTFVDFATKEDAQRAVDALNNSVVEGKHVELRPYSSVHPRRAAQIGKVDKGVLAQLLEADLVNTETGGFFV